MHRSPTTLHDVVHDAVRRAGTDVLDIDVRRSFILEDAVREGKKKKFCPQKLLKVCFVSVQYFRNTSFFCCTGEFCW